MLIPISYLIISCVIFLALGALVTYFIVSQKLKSQYTIEIHSLQNQVELEKSKTELAQTTLTNQQKQTQEIQQKLTLQFENLAHKIFNEKSEKFVDQNQQQLSQILNPLRDKIKDFEKKVEDTYSQERFERGHLKGEISKLIELNQTMSKEAHNLVQALKGENKTQGNWGEFILENILERSGLRKNEEFFTQETLKGSENEILRPDVIVKLPDGKHLIVDSKMTLAAYEAYSSADDENLRAKFADQHLDSLKKHVQGLSEKKYHLAEQIISPDFVLLFMPIEPAFALAFKLKPELFEQAWNKNVAIVSPTTLLATLRTVSSLWKQERQQRNAFEIAKRGGELYDKFAAIVKDLETLGDRLQSTSKAHSDIVNKFYVGRGNLITQVEKLKELGAKADKSLPPSHFEEN